MTGKSRRSVGVSVLVGVSLLLLPLLAILQYRWIGQVSDAERERSERTLRRATHEVAEDLDVELVRAAVGLAVDGSSLERNEWSEYSARYTGWQAAAAAPGIVGEILLVDRDEGNGIRLRRWDPDIRAFVPARWTDDRQPLRQEMEQRLQEWRNEPPDEPIRSSDLLTPDGEAIVIPVGPLPIPSAAEHLPITVFKPVFGYTIVGLDQQFIRTEFLPHLIDRHLRRETADDYRLAVVDRDDPARVIYRLNVDDLDDLLARHDTEEALFGVRPDVFRRAADSLRGPGSPTGDRRRSLFFSLTLRRPPPDESRRGGHPYDDLTRWRLVARHKAGSLEAAVTAARTRNLLLSFGVLLLMAGSVAMLATTTRRAERLARQQIEFVAAVSHELRTPVSVIGAAADNLAAGFVTDPARIRQYGTRIQTESRRLGETVERVLLFAGIESGRAAVVRTPTSVANLIEDALSASASAIADTSATVEKEVPPGLPPVLADASALRSCLQNLIANALKYGGRDRWVKVSAAPETRRSRREIRISVADHGLGIPPAELPHIFEPFYRGHEAQARQIQGNGLGLSIVKGIVESHGGRVSVESDPGRGSVFNLYLPVAEGETAPADAPVGQVRAATRLS